MRFIYHEYEKIPKLAWCAIAENRHSDIHVYHGSGVETFDTFFVEGAWDGEFLSAGFDQSRFFMGTGGKLKNSKTGEQVWFCAPNHVVERLSSIKDENRIFISNSLLFLLHMSNSHLDMGYMNYEADFNNILMGIKQYKRWIPLAEGKHLRLHYYESIILDSSFQRYEQKRYSAGPFKNYNHYYEELSKTLKRLASNGRDPSRKTSYGIVSTISKGYDSAACAAITRDAGCDIAVTFNKPEKYAPDSGEEIATRLGFKNIITKSADEYLSNTSLIEAEFIASGDLGSEIVFSAFEKVFVNNLVVIGYWGDSIWSKDSSLVNHEIRMEYDEFVVTSMIENRLRVGYILLLPTYFGALEWPSVNRITNSSEMKEYAIGGIYDRPIPRRILESKGVSRDMFGMKKKGAGFNYRYDNLKRIKKRMSKKSFESFYVFYKLNKRKGLKVFMRWIHYLWSTKTMYLSYFLSKLGVKYTSKSVITEQVSNPGAPSYLFNWGVHEMIKRYQAVQIHEDQPYR